MPVILLTLPSLVLLCIAILWLLFFHPGKHGGINRVLAMEMFIVGYNQFVIYGFQSSWFHSLALHLTYTDSFLFFLTMPLFYILLMHIIEERPFLSSQNAKHLWPSLPGLLYSINFGVLPEKTKELVGNGSSCGVLPDSFLYVFGAGSSFFYIYLCLRLVNRSIDEKASLVHPSSMRQLNFYGWVLYSFIFLCACYVILCIMLPTTLEIHYVILSLLVFVSAIELFLVFYVKPSSLQYISNSASVDKTENSPSAVKEKNEQLRVIAQQLERFMEEKKFYLDPDIDLSVLSGYTEIPGYKISACVREQFDMSVPEYLNRFRVAYAKKCLSEASMSAVKMDVLAYDCGFSSRSNFYSTFKKFTGVTPHEYKKLSSLPLADANGKEEN